MPWPRCPAIRRGLLAAGNPLSAAFWESAETILHKINDHDATFGDVHGWLEATGTEPTGIIGLHVWEEPSAAQPAAGRDARPAGRATSKSAWPPGRSTRTSWSPGDAGARQEYLALQERWMTTPLPDGRVPMTVLLDEQDEAFLADWAAADAEALRALRSVLETVGERPLPAAELGLSRREAARGHRAARLAGADARLVQRAQRRTSLPADDAEMWLTLATSVASPQGDPLVRGGQGVRSRHGMGRGRGPRLR